MPRLFTRKVFDQFINGTAEVVSSSDLREVLGRADLLIFEVYVGQAGGTSPTLTMKVEDIIELLDGLGTWGRTSLWDHV